MLLIIKKLKDKALMVRKDNDTDTIKDTIKLTQLLVTSLNGDKILLSFGIENIALDHGVIFLNFQARKLGGGGVKNCPKKYKIDYFGCAINLEFKF